MMDEVVQKFHTDGAEVLIVLPDWTNKPWWTLATALMSKFRYFPVESRMFKIETGKINAIYWGLRLIYIHCSNPYNCAIKTEETILKCPRAHSKSS